MKKLEEVEMIFTDFVMNLMDDLKKEFPESTRLELLNTAIQIERNHILKEAFNVDTNSDSHTTYLKSILEQQK